MALLPLTRTASSGTTPMAWRTRLFAAAYDRTGALDVTGLTPEQIVALRRRVPPAVPPVTWVTGRVPRGVRISATSAPARDGHVIPVRVYRPGAAGPLPVIAFFHGGGWVLGNVRGYDALCAHLAAHVGALVVSVDYRMAPEHKAPRAAHDCVDVVRWLPGAAAGMGGDPGRIAVAGDSAGGNLAAVTSQLVRDEGGPQLAHQALLYPAVDGTRSFPSVVENGHAPLLDRRKIDAFFGAYTDGSGLADDDPLVSPLFTADLGGLPPALVQTAELDPLRDEGLAYAAKLAAAGVPVRATTYVGTPHGFHSFPGATPIGPQARAELVSELRAHLT